MRASSKAYCRTPAIRLRSFSRAASNSPNASRSVSVSTQLRRPCKRPSRAPIRFNTHECEGLHHAVSGAQVNWQPYFRYWHGYRVILAPLVSAFPIWLIKIINAMMVAAACVLLWRTLRDYCDKTVATILMLSFVCLSDVLFIWRTSTHSLSLAYILAGASLFAAAMQRNWGSPGLIVLVDVMGSGFTFIDFLINPPMMPMLIAFFVLLSARPNTGLLALAA